MEQTAIGEREVTLEVENIGGIDESSVEFSPGVTVLAGRNATNRTSFLQAMIAALGGDTTSVKGDADTGRVEMTIGESTYTRTLSRENGTVVTDGDPYLDDPTLAELFAFLLETNEARQAVARGDALRDIIMEPVDTNEIESRIRNRRSERKRLDENIQEREDLKQRLPELESEKTEIQRKIDDRTDELSGVERLIEDAEANVDEKKEAQREVEEKIEELNEVRNEYESLRRKVDSQRESLRALREERSDLEEDLEEYEEVPDGRIEGVNAEIQRIRQQKNRIESSVDELQTVIQFNSELLDGTLDVFTEIDGESGDHVTSELLSDTDELRCWTCGGEADTSQIEAMLEDLRALRNQKMDRRNDLEEQIGELNEERRRLQEKRRQHEQITERLETVTDEIDDRESRLEELETRRDEAESKVGELETEVEELQAETEQNSELLDHHKEANRLQVEIDRLRSDLEATADDIERIEARLSEKEDLEAQREEIQREIEDLRTRVDRLEENAVTQFNEHMEQILDVLDYDNIERIWIERTDEAGANRRGNAGEGRFDIHVVRSTDSGRVYEDVIDHLSESEREVTGLVFALAGYLVHDVYEDVPFMLLDSLEAIDAPRLARLVDYFQEYADYLVVALLEEDAAALETDYERISDIGSA